MRRVLSLPFLLFFFNDTATTEIYTLSLHDALPIFACTKLFKDLAMWLDPPSELNDHLIAAVVHSRDVREKGWRVVRRHSGDRKSTRLNSSHSQISYAVFCLKKKIVVCRYASQRCSA